MSTNAENCGPLKRMNITHTLCAAYRTTSLNTKYQETVAAAPADSHGGDHTAQFVAASQGGGEQLPVLFCLQARDITLVFS